MNHNTQGVSRNGNQGGSGQAWPESVSGSQSLGPVLGHSPRVGAGVPSTARSRHDQATGDHRSRPVGGQASSPGLFGLPSAAGRTRQQGSTLKADDTARKVGGLTFAQRRNVIRSRVDMASVSLGAYERRPVPAGPSMESLMAAARARRVQATQDDKEATPKATPAMLAVAAASDAREAFPHFHDDEAAEFAHRCAGAGYVETMLAIEG